MERDFSKPLEEVIFTVQTEEEGLRLDQFLTERLFWRSRTSVQKLIEEPGRVSLQDAPEELRLRKSLRMQTGARVCISVPPPDQAIRHDEIPLRRLYEDDEVLVVDKQAGLLVHPVGRHQVNTLMNVLHHHYRNTEDPSRDVVPKLCHRLDRDTSGVILVAKSEDARRALQADFEAKRIVKRYQAVVEGRWPHPGPLTIDIPLARHPEDEKGLQMMVPGADHPPEEVLSSQSQARLLEQVGSFSLVELSPHTGRQHQLRVHAAALGHPLLCDPKYGSRFEVFPDADDLLLERQALHACHLAFEHPRTGRTIEVTAPLPGDFERVLEYLRQAGRA